MLYSDGTLEREGPWPRPNEMVCSCNLIDLQLPSVFQSCCFFVSLCDDLIFMCGEYLHEICCFMNILARTLVVANLQFWAVYGSCACAHNCSAFKFFFPMYFVFVVKLHLLNFCCTVWLRQWYPKLLLLLRDG
jgi:hypothetical protein